MSHFASRLARRELAHHYLLHSSLELNEPAYLPGYEVANSFFRAFHHWEGSSTGQWRALQKNSQGTEKALTLCHNLEAHPMLLRSEVCQELDEEQFMQPLEFPVGGSREQLTSHGEVRVGTQAVAC